MRCKYCNVEITCDSKICPLCHEKLSLPKDVDLPYDLPKAYPEKKKPPKRRERKKLSAIRLYLSIALTVFILSVPLNILTTPKIYWFAIVGVLVIYGFILVHNTILSNNGIGIKIFWQGVGIFSVLLTVNYLLDKQAPEYSPSWVWDYGAFDIDNRVDSHGNLHRHSSKILEQRGNRRADNIGTGIFANHTLRGESRSSPRNGCHGGLHIHYRHNLLLYTRQKNSYI